MLAMMARARKLSRFEMLESIPRLNPGVQWKVLDSGQILVVYAKAGSLPVRWLRKIFAVNEIAELLVDEIGARVVRKIEDGKTVGALIEAVAADLKLSRKEAETALVQFLNLLARRNLIGFEIAISHKVE